MAFADSKVDGFCGGGRGLTGNDTVAGLGSMQSCNGSASSLTFILRVRKTGGCCDSDRCGHHGTDESILHLFKRLSNQILP